MTSLRYLRINALRVLLCAVQTRRYLGAGTELYAQSERAAWKRTLQGQCVELVRKAKETCIEVTVRELRTEIRILERLSDEAYAEATREMPLTHWNIPLTHIAPYIHARGIEGCSYYAEQGAELWGWSRIGDVHMLRPAEVIPVLGHTLATDPLLPQRVGKCLI